METLCSNTRSYFILYGEDFPLEEFTKEIGITPTDAYRKGDEYRRGKNKHISGVTAWLLETDYVMTDFPEELIHNVVNP